MGDLSDQLAQLNDQFAAGGMGMGMDMSSFDPTAMLGDVNQLDLTGSPQVILPDNFVMPRDDSMVITIRDESGRAEVSEAPKREGTKVNMTPSGSY
jgi:hypothetical protein